MLTNSPNIDLSQISVWYKFPIIVIVFIISEKQINDTLDRGQFSHILYTFIRLFDDHMIYGHGIGYILIYNMGAFLPVYLPYIVYCNGK